MSVLVFSWKLLTLGTIEYLQTYHFKWRRAYSTLVYFTVYLCERMFYYVRITKPSLYLLIMFSWTAKMEQKCLPMAGFQFSIIILTVLQQCTEMWSKTAAASARTICHIRTVHCGACFLGFGPTSA